MVVPDELNLPSIIPSVLKNRDRGDHKTSDRVNKVRVLNFPNRRNVRRVQSGPAFDWEIALVSKLFEISSQHSGTTSQPQDILRKFQVV